MKKSNTFFYVLLAIIIIGIFSFLLLETGKKLKITYLIQYEKNSSISQDYGLIFREITEFTNLPMNQLEYQIIYYKNFLEFNKQLELAVKSRASNIIFCHFEQKETYDSFLKMNDYQSPVYLTFFKDVVLQNDPVKELLYLTPPSKMIADAINQLFQVDQNHNILLINNKKYAFRNSEMQAHLNGQKTTISIDEDEDLKSSINSIGDILSTMNPDYILIDLNEESTIALLEKIVGFPRDNIILFSKNTSRKVAYYTGSNSYGVNGITFTNPSQKNDFNNKTSLLKKISVTVADCFIQFNNVGIKELKQYLEENPSSDFNLINNMILTPVYRVSFTETGLKVIDKIDLAK